jgi:hypothetical protein
MAPAAPGFSQSGASRVPDTIVGPVLKHPVAPASDVNAVDKVAAQSKAGLGVPVKKKKASSRTGAAAPVQ